jgi:hypothetical protein
MKKLKILIVVLLITSTILDTGCRHNSKLQATNYASSSVTITTPANSPVVVEGRIDVNRVQVEPSLITFWGIAGLPDDTIIRSQLYEGETPLSWWPTDMDILIQNSQWTISVALESRGQVNNILVGPRYYYKVWQKDNPANSTGMFFDLIGPPKITPLWKQGIFWLLISIIIGIIIIALGIYNVIRLKRTIYHGQD